MAITYAVHTLMRPDTMHKMTASALAWAKFQRNWIPTKSPCRRMCQLFFIQLAKMLIKLIMVRLTMFTGIAMEAFLMDGSVAKGFTIALKAAGWRSKSTRAIPARLLPVPAP